jgi:hypothetical protein
MNSAEHRLSAGDDGADIVAAAERYPIPMPPSLRILREKFFVFRIG